MLRLALPFYIPIVIIKGLLLPFKKNLLHDGERRLNGIKKVASIEGLSFTKIKNASKRHGLTINNLVTACLSSALKEYFVLRGDTMTSEINVLIPANIRWNHYYKREDVKQENKFAPIGVTLKLKEDLKEAVKAATEANKRI